MDTNSKKLLMILSLILIPFFLHADDLENRILFLQNENTRIEQIIKQYREQINQLLQAGIENNGRIKELEEMKELKRTERLKKEEDNEEDDVIVDDDSGK